MEQICLHKVRKDIDALFVGFAPNGGSVKPVHIAGGSLRCIYGAYNKSISIKQMSLVSDSKGITPNGNDTDSIYTYLLENEKIEDSITKNSLESMRNVMQRLLSVDKGVYITKGLKDGMISYSAGSKYFLTNKAMYEDAGEFMGSVIGKFCPELANYIREVLDKSDDPITILFKPVLEDDEMVEYVTQNSYENLPAFSSLYNKTQWFLKGIEESGDCLHDNFRNHPNKLTQLRIFNLFCIFNLMRYMTLLESFYCKENVRPILLDFSGKSPNASSVARMSEMSFAQMYNSIYRFYAWSYANWLKEQGYSKEELLNSETPIYDIGKKETESSIAEMDALWSTAKKTAINMNLDEIYELFGGTMYDMIALKASSNPISYIRTLGTSSGILYPPDNRHPAKRFVVSQDVLEMLLRGCVKPGEVISGKQIRERMWNRFGVLIGGSQFEMDELQKSGMILQSDEDALEENFSSFAATLENMDFAEEMADGILQIRLGGIKE